MTKTITAVEARKNFGRFLNIVALTHTDLTIERAGTPIARLVGIDYPDSGKGHSGRRSIRDSRGVGAEIWREVGGAAYLAGERAEWD